MPFQKSDVVQFFNVVLLAPALEPEVVEALVDDVEEVAAYRFVV